MQTRARPDAVLKPKRFWTAAAAGPEGEGGRPVLLDGRPARTPAGLPLRLPTRPLAELVAAEWAAVGEELDYAAMPATRLAFTVIDRVPAAREAVVDEAARYAGSDLLCYFADEPRALAERQAREWSPLLDWAEAELGLPLVRTAGVVHAPQPPETLARARDHAAALDDAQLAALAYAAPLFGSVVLALAVQRGRLTGEEAFDLSRLDEAHQEAFWGVDAEAAARTARLRAEAVMLDRWFRALEP
jgi:chaperone required for assembly of F1-ATPase